MSRIYTINSRKFDGTICRTWRCEFVSGDSEKIDLVGSFEDRVEHPDLGIIEAGTISRERFYFDRWYNYFIFEQPAGRLRNSYFNICMPPNVGYDVIDYIDLDLDLIVWPNGRQTTLDLEEFYANCNAFGYPEHIKTRALEELKTVQLLADSATAMF
jgi:protein associated with RNAse G/E